MESDRVQQLKMMGQQMQMQHEQIQKTKRDCDHEWQIYHQQRRALINLGPVSVASTVSIPRFPTFNPTSKV